MGSLGCSSARPGCIATCRVTFLSPLTLEYGSPPERPLLADLSDLFSPGPHHRVAGDSRPARRAGLSRSGWSSGFRQEAAAGKGACSRPRPAVLTTTPELA